MVSRIGTERPWLPDNGASPLLERGRRLQVSLDRIKPRLMSHVLECSRNRFVRVHCGIVTFVSAVVKAGWEATRQRPPLPESRMTRRTVPLVRQDQTRDRGITVTLRKATAGLSRLAGYGQVGCQGVSVAQQFNLNSRSDFFWRQERA